MPHPTRTLTLALSSTCLGLALWGSALPAASLHDCRK